MSLFKIVGNYYEDILDYYTREYKKLDPTFDAKKMELEYLKHQGNPAASPILTRFKAKFYSIFDLPKDMVTKKTEIVKLLASTYMKLDRLRESDANYWASRARSYVQLQLIMWVMLGVLGYFILFYLRKIQQEGVEDRTERIQIFIAYITAYTIVFCIFLTFIINLIEGIKMSREKVHSHGNQFTSFNLILVPNIQFQLFFTALGYMIVNQNGPANRINKKLKDSTKSKGSKTEDKACSVNTSTRITNYVLDKDPCKNKANLDEVYDDLKQDIVEYIFNFYNYGHGYSVLRKAVTKSTNNYMLKEVRTVMAFYYHLLNKKGEDDIDKQTLENNRKIINKVVISKLDDIKLSYFFEIDDGAITERKDLIAENEDPSHNPSYVKALENLKSAIVYLGMFLYPLYLREAPTSAVVQSKPIYVYLPQNIADDNADNFKLKSKDYFSRRLGTSFNDMLLVAKNSNPAEFGMAMAEFITQYQDYIAMALNDMILVLKGPDMFPLDERYIASKIDAVYRLVPFAYADNTYKQLYKEALLKVLLPKIKTKMYAEIGNNAGVDSMINFKESLIIDGLAEEMSSYKINVKENIPYILEELMKKRGKDLEDKLVAIFKTILTRLDGAIDMKKKMRRINDDKVEPRFVSNAEFTNRLNELMFNDVLRGLDSQYLYELLNDFYMEVSGAIGTNQNTSAPVNRTDHNIFYAQQKKFKVGQWILFMVYVVISEMYVYYVMGWSKQLREISLARSSLNISDPNYKSLKILVGTKFMNHIIKLLILTAVALFIMSMLYSYYKKATDKFEFNRDTIETNTGELIDAITKLDTQISVMRQYASKSTFTRIGDISTITDEMKAELYKNMLELTEKYEKCNYIINVSQSYLPFPYTEITVDAFMIFATVMCFLYVFGKIDPVGRLRKIRKLQKLYEDSMFMNDAELAELINIEKACNVEEIDAVVFTLKIIFFSFLFMFLIFYTLTIITSTSDFKNGLYNSAYFEESRCYNG